VVASDTRFLYDGWNLVADFSGFDALASADAGPVPRTRDSNLNLLRSYVWGMDLSGTFQGAGGVGGLLQVSVLLPSPFTLLPSYDGNGNILSAIDASNGTVAATYEYGPFGEPLRATGPAAAANPFRFSTKYSDAETGLLYYGYRYYSTSLRRWLSRDPIQERGGVNLYGMVGNNPVSHWDKLGLKCDCDEEMRKACAMIDAVIDRYQKIVALHAKALGEVTTVEGWAAYRNANGFGIGGYAFTGATEETQRSVPKPIVDIVDSVELETGIGRAGFVALTGIPAFLGGLVAQDWDLAESSFVASIIIEEKYAHSEALKEFRELKTRCTKCGF
jgi:RHS repeat-associated protein